jgi:arginyl-tRNA--protein-N-Asp/Glu arginylyltransferase
MGAEQVQISPKIIDFNCTYKPGQLRQLFSIHYPSGSKNTTQLYSDFLPRGFTAENRSVHGHSCLSCSACVILRIRANDYPFSYHERKIIKANNDLKVSFKETRINQEHFELFRRYTSARHPENTEHLAFNTSTLQGYLESHSHMMEIRNKDNTLAAVLIVDMLENGFNGYNVFFDPDMSQKRSLGRFATLTLLGVMHNDTPTHLYIGAWVKDNPKLDYKKHFHNLEMFAPDGKWHPFNPETHHTGGKPSRVIPIQPV